MNIKPTLFVFVLLIGMITAYSQGTLVIDQSAGPPTIISGEWLGIQTNAPIGQSLTPALNSIGYVALGMAGSGTATVYVNVRASSITGTILGSSTPVSVSNSSGNDIFDFYFPTAISLTPGTTYFFDVNQSSGTPWLVNIYGYEYAGGTAFLKGAALTQDDLWFQDGVVVPEPSVAWLVLVGGGIFFSARRWPKSPES
jgi:hypothetical protein